MPRHYVTVSFDQSELESIVLTIKSALNNNPTPPVVKPLTSALLTLRAGAVRAGWNGDAS